MSAPKTNIEVQKRRHLAPLFGMALVALFGAGLILYWLFEESAGGDAPGNDPSEQSEERPNDATNPPEPAE